MGEREVRAKVRSHTPAEGELVQAEPSWGDDGREKTNPGTRSAILRHLVPVVADLERSRSKTSLATWIGATGGVLSILSLAIGLAVYLTRSGDRAAEVPELRKTVATHSEDIAALKAGQGYILDGIKRIEKRMDERGSKP
jgi:hypothetical protein